MFVLPLEKELIKTAEEGNKKPSATPKSIDKKIQIVKYRSKKPSCFRSATGVQLFADILFF
ncbi:hypothetical protein GCM10007422_22800 [Pedobacter zeae]|uniref:Uncharacterized protein n=1 Tax=Pedobacter zeae TaxID=1737356 RepID=A0ABQ1XYB1_9SPHI|nr:hypothetical protein GCM10007422_22800 [Pedobacter zeae]